MKKSMNSLIDKLKKGKNSSKYCPLAVVGVREDDISKKKKEVKKEELNRE